MNEPTDQPLPDPTARPSADVPNEAEVRQLLGLPDVNAPELPAPRPIVHRRPRRPDPWAHRRGEPRVVAFLWTSYLLLTIAGSLTWLAQSSALTTDAYGPAARIMLVVVAAGAMVLWPMVRLSQASPPRGTSALRWSLLDVVVILTPMQMMIWPLVMLAHWPVEVVGAVAALMGAWVVLTQGIVACALAGPRADVARERGLGQRALWMVLIIALLGFAPMTMLGLRWREGRVGDTARTPQPVWLPMLSPFTGIASATGRGLVGPTGPVSTDQWRAIGVVAAAGLLPWGMAFIRGQGGTDRTRGLD